MSPKRSRTNLVALAAFVLLALVYFASRAKGDDHMMPHHSSPVCHTDTQLERVAGLKLKYKHWDAAVNAINSVNERAVCMLQPVKFEQDLMLSVLRVGNDVYELWQVQLTSIRFEGRWHDLEKPVTQYALIPVHVLVSNPQPPATFEVAGRFVFCYS